MKCPKCGINYDDSDRECPMCGAPKPLFAKDKSKLAKATARPAKSPESSGANKKKDDMGSILDLGKSKKSDWSKPKKDGKGKAIAIVILIAVLINIIPVLLNLASDIQGVVTDIAVPEPEAYENSIDILYQIDGSGEIFVFNDGTYHVSSEEYDEWGTMAIYGYDINEIPEFESFLEQYGIYKEDVDISIAAVTKENAQNDKYMLILKSKYDDLVYFYDVSGDIDWIEDNILVGGSEIT